MGKTLKKIQTRNPIILQLHLGMGHWGLMVCKVSIHGDNALTFTYITARSRSLNDRATRSKAGGRGLESRPRHTKELNLKMVSVATMLGAQTYMAGTGFSSHNKYMHNLHRNTYKKKEKVW